MLSAVSTAFTGCETMKKQALFLAFELPHPPALYFGLLHEKGAFERVGNFQYLHDMVPTQFWGQRSQNWIFEEKHPHIVDIRVVVPTSKPGGQVEGEVAQQFGAVFRPLLAVLLVLHDVLTDVPISHDHGLVNSGNHPFAPIVDRLLDLGDEVAVWVGGWQFWFAHDVCLIRTRKIKNKVNKSAI